MVLFVLYAYIFDAANQAKGADEDRINKPYRPVPAGLITPAGALRRFWIAMPLYSLLGWALGVLERVLLWQAIVVFLNLICSPRYYLWCKTPCCLGGALAQLSAAWQLVSPIDATIVVWMAVIYQRSRPRSPVLARGGADQSRVCPVPMVDYAPSGSHQYCFCGAEGAFRSGRCPCTAMRAARMR